MFFNNPNQLALWGICLLIIIYIVTKILKKDYKSRISVLLICSLLITASNSIAGIIGMIFFWIVFFIQNKTETSKFIVIFCIAVISGAAFLNLKYNNFTVVEKAVIRFQTDQIDNNLSARGFDRIVNNYEL